MSITYKQLSRRPQVFLRASGVTKDIFDEIIHMTINKDKKLSQEDLEICLIDATEQKTQRPSTTDQKPFYSGKKKQHTLKTEIKRTPQGKITNVSKSVPGATHDYNLAKI